MAGLWQILICAALAAAIVSAETQDRTDFAISVDYSFSEQSNPAVASGQRGRYAVVWTDYRNGAGDIFGQLFDSGGVVRGDNFLINDDGNGAVQLDPDVSSDWYGYYHVVWQDYRNGAYPFGPDVYYQRLDSAGRTAGNSNVSTELPDSSHQSPAIGTSGWGKSTIAWDDLRNRNWDIFTQSLNADGSPAGQNRRVNDDNSISAQHEPNVAVAPDGWFVAVWYDNRSGNDDIYLQKFDSSGLPVGGNLRVNDDGGTTKQKFPCVAIGGMGTIFVIWTDWRNGVYPANSDIYAQRLDADLNRLGRNVLVNTDGRAASQRNPRVAADRIGNACIVWSDSTNTDWDIAGQMIDYTGVMRGLNFSVNVDRPGRQLHPDVALDGLFAYFVWTDDRSGNYDIYGRIWQYNTPALAATPQRLDFTKDRSDPEPDPVLVTLTNAGLGELTYQIKSDAAWLSVSKTSGTTPDSLLVSVNSDSLGFGIHQGRLTLIDQTHGDSSAFIPVILTISGPILDFQPDSLQFRALVELGSPGNQNVAIQNAGTGALDWSLTASAPWITLDRISGAAGDVIGIGCDVSALTAGIYAGYVIATDTNATNTPESLLVSLALESNLPFLTALPERVEKNLLLGQSSVDSIRIINLGGTALDWRASCTAPWASLERDSGSDNDLIVVRFESAGLDRGTYIDSIRIEDSLAFNSPIFVPYRAVVDLADTFFIPPGLAGLGESFQLPINLYSHRALRGGQIQMGYDSRLWRVDSLLGIAGESPFDISGAIDTSAGTVTVMLTPFSADSVVSPGRFLLANLYVTGNDSVPGTGSFSLIESDSASFLEDPDSVRSMPILSAGEVEVSGITAVDNTEINPAPVMSYLAQNSPNPFNDQTTLTFSIARTGPVKLEVYNILGQLVDILVDDERLPGQYLAVWDGHDASHREMASGIYFYRLSAPEYTSVRKMVFLK
jgi:hypothetical protein